MKKARSIFIKRYPITFNEGRNVITEYEIDEIRKEIENLPASEDHLMYSLKEEKPLFETVEESNYIVGFLIYERHKQPLPFLAG